MNKKWKLIKKNEHYSKLKYFYYYFKNKLNPPKIPVQLRGQTFIHLGCGEVILPGYINVDAFPYPHVHYIANVRKLKIFPNNYADLIYASHVFEHIPRRLIRETLEEWKRVLRPRGILRLSVPDFELILSIYNAENKSINEILDPLFGSQTNAFDFHYSAYTFDSLSSLLLYIGFNNIRRWDPEKLGLKGKDWSGKIIRTSHSQIEYPISLNIESEKT